jgi:hypothetical protein
MEKYVLANLYPVFSPVTIEPKMAQNWVLKIGKMLLRIVTTQVFVERYHLPKTTPAFVGQWDEYRHLFAVFLKCPCHLCRRS